MAAETRDGIAHGEDWRDAGSRDGFNWRSQNFEQLVKDPGSGIRCGDWEGYQIGSSSFEDGFASSASLESSFPLKDKRSEYFHRNMFGFSGSQ